MPTSYQEPIEKEDINTEGRFQPGGEKLETGNENIDKTGKENLKSSEIPKATEFSAEKIPGIEAETGKEAKPEEVSEKIETARKKLSVSKALKASDVSADAQAISQIQEYEKKVEKLVELALQKGPLHAIKVAQHMDKGKDSVEQDNYTLDEIHDRLLEEELHNQLVQKGLLKEL